MPSLSPSLSLTITNPLVLYRTLLATKRIDPDPAQHRLALHLQKVYNRLESYSPDIDYSHRLDQINRAVGNLSSSSTEIKRENDGFEYGKVNGFFASLRGQKLDRNTLAITKQLTSHESAIELQSPQGLLLYGDVGTGKSMLIDLLADCLPAQKKRRCHFNNFMLETFAKLEQLRRKRSNARSTKSTRNGKDEEHSLLCIARDLISTSPILFLDEFQLPDRVASKILSNLLTAFFHLGGVLIATSNRMPEELAKASGVEFAAPPSSRVGLFKNRWGLIGAGISGERNESMSSRKGDFARFLDVLRARCEIWDMEGSKDWRRQERKKHVFIAPTQQTESAASSGNKSYDSLEDTAISNVGMSKEQSKNTNANEDKETNDSEGSLPKYYFVRNSSLDLKGAVPQADPAWATALSTAVFSISSSSSLSVDEIPWTPTSLRIYGRNLPVPRHLHGVTYWAFPELCCTNLGPADYISIASTFHTIVVTEIPILTMLHKNEARRLITLLDALYEARCKVLIHAAAGPDMIFFPETRDPLRLKDADPTTEAMHPETFAEIYQDQTSPFRPNTASTYHPSASAPSYHSLPVQRSILADEDSDFGPLSSKSEHEQQRFETSDGPPGAGNEIGRTLDFSRTVAFTGEDERFAYKRARSRLWEMCSARWWAARDAGSVEEWWRPVRKESRVWEGRDTGTEEEAVLPPAVPSAAGTAESSLQAGNESQGKHPSNDEADERLFHHGASPFRVHAEPPPRFGWVHAWGMMRWGRKAGVWGKGVEGLDERRVGGGGGGGEEVGRGGAEGEGATGQGVKGKAGGMRGGCGGKRGEWG